MDNTKHLDKVKPRQSRQATVYVVDLLTFVTCPRKARLSREVLSKKNHDFVCFLRCGCNVQHLSLSRGNKDERGQGGASFFYLYTVEQFAQGLTSNLIERLLWIFLFIYCSSIWYTFCETEPIMLPVGAVGAHGILRLFADYNADNTDGSLMVMVVMMMTMLTSTIYSAISRVL